jgi:hypothetical protein
MLVRNSQLMADIPWTKIYTSRAIIGTTVIIVTRISAVNPRRSFWRDVSRFAFSLYPSSRVMIATFPGA